MFLVLQGGFLIFGILAAKVYLTAQLATLGQDGWRFKVDFLDVQLAVLKRVQVAGPETQHFLDFLF